MDTAQSDLRRKVLEQIRQNHGIIDPEQLAEQLRVSVERIIGSLQALRNQGLITSFETLKKPNHIFIGHGHSDAWKTLKEFLAGRLGLKVDDFENEFVAGYAIPERLTEMLDRAAFAFLVMTAEDEAADGTMHARENVIHEVGLFQGRLGFRKAIVLLEQGCHEFSNIHGLLHIEFPRNDIMRASEQIRGVLEREGVIKVISRAAGE